MLRAGRQRRDGDRRIAAGRRARCGTLSGRGSEARPGSGRAGARDPRRGATGAFRLRGCDCSPAGVPGPGGRRRSRDARLGRPGSADATLLAFGGAGPVLACGIAEAAGITRVIIPGLAAVFSAFGIGFSDIGHTYEYRCWGAASSTSQRRSTSCIHARGEACSPRASSWMNASSTPR